MYLYKTKFIKIYKNHTNIIKKSTGCTVNKYSCDSSNLLMFGISWQLITLLGRSFQNLIILTKKEYL